MVFWPVTMIFTSICKCDRAIVYWEQCVAIIAECRIKGPVGKMPEYSQAVQGVDDRTGYQNLAVGLQYNIGTFGIMYCINSMVQKAAQKYWLFKILFKSYYHFPPWKKVTQCHFKAVHLYRSPADSCFVFFVAAGVPKPEVKSRMIFKSF